MKVADLDIEYRFSEESCDAYLNGSFIGGVDFMDKEDTGMDNVLVIQYAVVKEEYRGIGLYKEILSYASNNMEEDYILSDKRTEDATRFYQKYCNISDYDEATYNHGSQEKIKIYAGFYLEV
jgi:hypothetical protein